MAKYYEVSSPRKGKDGKTFWRRIGTAFDAKNGDGMNVELDALPLTDNEGRCTLIIRPPQERQTNNSASTSGGPLNVQLNDEVPFAPEWR